MLSLPPFCSSHEMRFTAAVWCKKTRGMSGAALLDDGGDEEVNEGETEKVAE